MQDLAHEGHGPDRRKGEDRGERGVQPERGKISGAFKNQYDDQIPVLSNYGEICADINPETINLKLSDLSKRRPRFLYVADLGGYWE